MAIPVASPTREKDPPTQAMEKHIQSLQVVNDAEKVRPLPATVESTAKPPLDWDHLRELSLRPGGFQEQRAELWRQLLNVDPQPAQQSSMKHDADTAPQNDIDVAVPQVVEPHPDERQVRLDTDRSFVLYPVGDIDERQHRQNELYDLIVEVFRKRRRLHYFQGYHDIISVLYLTLPKDLQLPAAEKLSLHRLRDAMGSGLEPIIGLLRVLQRVLRDADPEYAAMLENVAPLPYFALSNLLTLFSHDMPTLPLIQHVFDYLLARPPIASVYLAAAVLLSRKEEVRRLEEEGEEGMIHSLLSSLPDLYDDDDSVNTPVPPKTEIQNTQKDDDEHSAKGPTAGSEPPGLGKSHLEPPQGREQTPESTESDEPVVSHPSNPVSVEATSSPSERGSLDDSAVSQPDESTLVNDLPTSSQAEMSSPFPSPEDDTLILDGDEKLGHAHDPSIETVGSFQTAPEEIPTGPSSLSLCDSPVVSPMEDINQRPRIHIAPTEDSIRPPRIHISTLLNSADDLFVRYPPMDPLVDLPSIMGPQSVVLTWSEDPARLPREDDAELVVLQPQLVVLRPPEEHDKKEADTEAEHEHDRKRKPRKLHKKPRRMTQMVLERRTVVSAVLVVGVAVAAYGLQITPERRHSHMREMRKLGKLAGGVLVSVSRGLWDGLIAMAG